MFYSLLQIVCGPFYKIFYRAKFIGKENIPSDGGAVLCCNHIGISDIFLLGVASKRQLFFISKKEWFKIPVLRGIIKRLGAIELDRGGKDVGALKAAIKTVKSNKIVAIFPQGHRYPNITPDKTPIKNGAALIAYHASCNVIPVCIKTKDVKYRLFRRIEVIVGKPLSHEELGLSYGGYDEYKHASDKIFNEICTLGGYGSYGNVSPNKEDN